MPVVVLYRYCHSYNYLFGDTVAALWWSSGLLMATAGHEQDPDFWAAVAFTIALNMLSYAIVATLVWFVAAWISGRIKRRTP